MDKINKVREIFLDPSLDEEERKENEEQIRQWETTLVENEGLASLQEHDTSKQIIAQLRKSYRDFSLSLAMNRNLTEKERFSLWAKQDACEFLLSILNKDAKSALKSLDKEVRHALNAT